MSGSGLFVTVRRVLLIQVLTILGIFAVTFGLAGFQEARSALLGGLVAFLPNVYFAVKFGRRDPTKTANDVVRAFYRGEAIKLVLTALLFVIVFQLPGISFMPLFIGFVAVIMVFWFALLLRN